MKKAPDLENHVEEIVQSFFNIGRQTNDKNRMLEVLSERGVSEAVKWCVDKNDKETLIGMIRIQVDGVYQHMKKKNVQDKESIMEELQRLREERSASVAPSQETDMKKAFDNFLNKKAVNGTGVSANQSRSDNDQSLAEEDMSQIIDISDDDEVIPPPTRGRGRGRGSRGGRGTAAAETSTSRGASAPKRRGGRTRGGF